jgi:hypothetical protein
MKALLALPNVPSRLSIELRDFEHCLNLWRSSFEQSHVALRDILLLNLLSLGALLSEED